MSRRQFHLDGPDPETLDDTGCTVLHVDMDAFYASVTLLEHPDLVGTPVIIGGGTRGVVLSATYEARRFGVTSAMPMGRARRLCPQATILRPDHERYAQVSKGVMAVFRSVTPVVEPLSVDEAFLDVSGSVRTHGRPVHIARHIRDAVADEQGITCSVGIASTKFVAKLASGLAKPDGLRVVPVGQVVPTLHQLPVGALWGVGDKTEESLLRLGLRTVADIAHTPLPTLQRALGPAMGASLHELSWGRDPRRVTPTHVEKSIGADETFGHDIDDPVEIHRHLLALAERSTARARAQGMTARTVSIKVRFADFTTITRARTLREHTDVSQEVYRVAKELYDALGLQRARVRLVGVRLESLASTGTVSRQGLLDEPEHGWRDAERAVDRASARFGAGVVRPASLVGARRSGRDPETPATVRRKEAPGTRGRGGSDAPDAERGREQGRHPSTRSSQDDARGSTATPARDLS